MRDYSELIGVVALGLTACSGNVTGPSATPSRARQEMTACAAPVKGAPKPVVAGGSAIACPDIIISE
ncbi:MAG: hypothetical protein WCK74_00030 [Gemmatimonadaceae bacterium]